jgi:hypothetical protein
MDWKSTLLKAGALYAAGRLASGISAEDVARVTGISGDDVRRYGVGRADALLHQIGLQRESTVRSSTVLVLSGFAAGAVVGSGVMFLFYSEQGKEVRRKIVEYFAKSDSDESAEGEAARANNGGADANASR